MLGSAAGLQADRFAVFVVSGIVSGRNCLLCSSVPAGMCISGQLGLSWESLGSFCDLKRVMNNFWVFKLLVYSKLIFLQLK